MIHVSPRQTTTPVRAMYRRCLASWAMDLMELRRRGLDRPGRRIAVDDAGPVSPGRAGGAASDPAPVRALAPSRRHA